MRQTAAQLHDNVCRLKKLNECQQQYLAQLKKQKMLLEQVLQIQEQHNLSKRSLLYIEKFLTIFR